VKFSELEFRPYGGEGYKGVLTNVMFPNGQGASIIRYTYTNPIDGLTRSGSYGAQSGLYELAVLDKDGNRDYTTPVTSDVCGRLTEDEVTALLERIEALPDRNKLRYQGTRRLRQMRADEEVGLDMAGKYDARHYLDGRKDMIRILKAGAEHATVKLMAEAPALKAEVEELRRGNDTLAAIEVNRLRATIADVQDLVVTDGDSHEIYGAMVAIEELLAAQDGGEA
jgi:hypothetical protein